MPRAPVVLVCLVLLAWLAAAASLAQPHEPPLDKRVIARAVAQADFETIESFATAFRESRARATTGEWQLTRLYDAVEASLKRLGNASDGAVEAKLARWREAYPASITWRVVQMEWLSEKAWDARGTGWASTVTPEGWAGFKRHLRQAWAIYEEARELDTRDPALYAAATTVAMGLGYEPKAEPSRFGRLFRGLLGLRTPPPPPPPPLYEGVLEEALQHETEYGPLYARQATARLPRWQGSYGDVEEFAQEVADRRQSETYYARIAMAALDYLWEIGYWKETHFDWVRIRAGFEQLIEQFPQSNFLRNYYCLMACIHEDRETAARVLPTLKPPLLRKVWLRRDRFVTWKRWIEGEGPYPRGVELSYAVIQGDVDAVREMIADGMPVNDIHVSGRTPLYLAMQQNEFEILEMLFDAGATAEVRSSSGNTPIKGATLKRRPDMLKALLENGADPDFTTIKGWTALHHCAKESKPAHAALLLDAGADLELPLPGGHTPLTIAIEVGNEDMARFFIEHGADTTVALDNGVTAKRLARARGLTGIVDLLE